MSKVLLLLAGGYECYEASVFIDVMGWNLVYGDRSTRLFSCGLRREVKSTFDQRCVVDFLAEEINVDDFDALAIPGGFEDYHFYKDAYDERFLDLIRRFKEKDKYIAAICVGALPLGKSGILKGKNATTYNRIAIRQNELRAFGANVLNQPVVVDDSIVTCWNPANAINVAFLMLEHLTSRDNVEHLKSIMGFKDRFI